MYHRDGWWQCWGWYQHWHSRRLLLAPGWSFLWWCLGCLGLLWTRTKLVKVGRWVNWLLTPIVSLMLGIVPQSWWRDIQRDKLRSTKGEMITSSESGVLIKPYGSKCSTCSGGAEGQSQGFLANFMKQRWVVGADKGTNSTLLWTLKTLHRSSTDDTTYGCFQARLPRKSVWRAAKYREAHEGSILLDEWTYESNWRHDESALYCSQ